MTTGAVDFATAFKGLGLNGDLEQTTAMGGMDVRLVRVVGGGEGRWDRHEDGPETVIVWSGAFTVEFRAHTLQLTAGMCCVVPANAEHRGTSPTGAEVILLRSTHALAAA